jgi:hypothetical protein
MNMTPWDNTLRYDTTGDIVTGTIIGTVIALILGALCLFLFVLNETPQEKKEARNNGLSSHAEAIFVLVMLGAMFGFMGGGVASVPNTGDFNRERVQNLQSWLKDEYAIDVDIEDAQTLKYSLQSRSDIAVTIDGRLTNVHLVKADEGGVLLATSDTTLIEQK